MKKIKIFLGGYVNFLNAQNINCRALSEHLDKEKFRVSTMLYPIGNAADFCKVPEVRYIQQYRPMRWLGWLGYLRGIAGADVAYLPKGEYDAFCRIWARLCRTKVFTTLEGLIGDVDLSKMSAEAGKAYVEHFRGYEPHLYAITRFLASDVAARRGYRFAPEILYLGVQSSQFENPDKMCSGLNNVVFIGNKLPTKNIGDFLEASEQHPDIQFHIVGDHLMKTGTIQEYISEHQLRNVTYHGRLNHSQLAELLHSMDLMYFPSRSEGFPKVHLETACAGVPTLCYDDYGADEWITSGKDGYVVRTKEEAFAVIEQLKSNPAQLAELSRNAVALGKRFDWKVLVKRWEDVITKIDNEA